MLEQSDYAVPGTSRAAALAYLLPGLGFGVGAVVTLALFARDGQLPMTPWGFRSLDGPFARIGQTETLLFGAALVAACAADVVAAAGLWRGRRWAGRLGMLTTPFAVVLGLGFQLPFLLLAIPVRAGLLAAAWQRLR